MLTRRLFGFSAAAAAGVAVSGIPLLASANQATSTPRLDYRSSMLGDYLFLLAFRPEKPRLPVFQSDLLPPPLENVDAMISVPELTALAGLTRYEDVEPLMQRNAQESSFTIPASALEAGTKLLAAGAAAYPAFQAYWRDNISPLVEAEISAWREQDRQHSPLSKLTAMHRLPGLPDPVLPLVVMPFHPAGSGTVKPLGLYTSLFKKPDLGWFLGHEATHVIWRKSGPDGWSAHPLAAQANQLAEPVNVSPEEIACWLMQAAVSRECGVSPADFRIADRFQDGPNKLILKALEDRWPEYMASPDRWPTSIDYVLQTTIEVLTPAAA